MIVKQLCQIAYKPHIFWLFTFPSSSSHFSLSHSSLSLSSTIAFEHATLITFCYYINQEYEALTSDSISMILTLRKPKQFCTRIYHLSQISILGTLHDVYMLPCHHISCLLCILFLRGSSIYEQLIMSHDHATPQY